MAHRIRDCVPASARAPVARSSRVHRGNARLHGTRADGTNESLGRLSERPLFAWSDVLRNVDRDSSIHGLRTHGMAALSYRETTSRPQSAGGNRTSLGLRDHDEVALQDRGGKISDSGGS